jgi:hypothetical protein
VKDIFSPAQSKILRLSYLNDIRFKMKQTGRSGRTVFARYISMSVHVNLRGQREHNVLPYNLNTSRLPGNVVWRGGEQCSPAQDFLS